MPQLDPEKALFAAQLFWLGLSFFTLYSVVAFFITPRLNYIFLSRRAIVERDLEKAEMLKNETDNILTRYQKKIEAAKLHSQQTFETLRLQLLNENESLKLAHSTQLSAKIADAEIRINASRVAAMSTIQESASELVGLTAQKVSGQKETEKSIQSAINAVT